MDEEGWNGGARDVRWGRWDDEEEGRGRFRGLLSLSFPAAKLNRYAAFLTLHGDLQSQRRDKRKTRVTGYGYRREDALAWKWRNDINEHE